MRSFFSFLFLFFFQNDDDPERRLLHMQLKSATCVFNTPIESPRNGDRLEGRGQQKKRGQFKREKRHVDMDATERWTCLSVWKLNEPFLTPTLEAPVGEKEKSESRMRVIDQCTL